MIKMEFELNDKDGLRIKREKKMELDEERKKTIKMELELNEKRLN